MARPRIPIGAYGAIKTKQEGTKQWRADTTARLLDGSIRRVRRWGATKTAAVSNLKAALVQLLEHGTRDTTTLFSVVCADWTVNLDVRAETGAIAAGTARVYKGHLRKWILPSLGRLPCFEIKPATCDTLLQAVQSRTSYDTAKSVRAALSSACTFAMRHGAMDDNPVKSTGRLGRGEAKKVRALTHAERADLLAKLEALAAKKQTDAGGRSLGARGAVWASLPDLVRVMLATGVRIGELLALDADDIDTEARTVNVGHHIIRKTGVGLVRAPNRKSGDGLVLRVPAWAVPTLRELAQDGGPLFPGLRGGWQDPNGVIGRLREAFDSCEYGWVTSHVFRKTVATVLDQAGVQTTQIADQLGNTPAVVERHYRAPRVASEGSADALENLWNA